jgi:hypothetical protein
MQRRQRRYLAIPLRSDDSHLHVVLLRVVVRRHNHVAILGRKRLRHAIAMTMSRAGRIRANDTAVLICRHIPVVFGDVAIAFGA